MKYNRWPLGTLGIIGTKMKINQIARNDYEIEEIKKCENEFKSLKVKNINTLKSFVHFAYKNGCGNLNKNELIELLKKHL